MKVAFNRGAVTGKELGYMRQTLETGHTCGDGPFTKKCQEFFESRWGMKKCLLTTSCTDALEMAALLLDIGPGDEVIVPSYTFVSSALAFARAGATIRFVDSRGDHPGMDENLVEREISEKTKLIVAVHYAGVSCDMDALNRIARERDLHVVEDAAQCIDSHFRGRPLGGVGSLGCFSFHQTKNLQCGEGGLLAVNAEEFEARSEVIREKGTNRRAFLDGEVDKYTWVDTGSSFLPSDINAAFLYAQLQQVEKIQEQRLRIWNAYEENLAKHFARRGFMTPCIPAYASNNAHMYYVVAPTRKDRDAFISGLRQRGALAVFHYQPLHQSTFYARDKEVVELVNAERFGNCLIRLPLYYGMSEEETQFVCRAVIEQLGEGEAS